MLYRSAELEKLWPYGHSTVGSMTFKSAAYVARYILKKRNGPDAKDHYNWTDDTGVRHNRVPEFAGMSRDPGIGKPWLDRYGADVYPDDFVLVNGKRCRPPRFYDKQLELSDCELYEEIKTRRTIKAEKLSEHSTTARLRDREKIHNQRLAKLRKSL